MKKRWLLIPLALLICVMVFLSVTQDEYPNKRAVTSQQTAHTVKPTPKPPTKESLLAAVNAERAKYGVPALVEDSRLDSSAQAKACDERDNHYFGHVNPSGVRGRDTAYQTMGQAAGNYDENLVEDAFTTEQAMSAWIKSAPHHEGMISAKYNLTGFGVCGNEIAEHFYGPF